MVEYSYLINKAIQSKLAIPKTIITVGCVGSVFGYLPTDKLIEEGGYESKDFFSGFALKGSYKQNIQVGIVSYITKFILKNIN